MCRLCDIALALSLALVGAVCSHAVPEWRAQPPVADTLVLWVMDQDINTGSSLQKLMRKFSLQSGVPVKIRFVDWSSAFDDLDRTLKTEAGANSDFPDIVQLGSSWVPYFANAGLIAPLSNLVASIDTSRFYSEVMKASHIGRDTTVYSIPWFIDVRGFFVNERLWLELGLHDSEIDNYPKFFGVLQAVARAKVVNGENGLVVPFQFGVKDDWTGYQQVSPFLWNFGGDFIAETDSGYRSALADSLTLEGLRHYLQLLRDQEVSPYNLRENSSQSAIRFVRAEQLMIFGTSELIRKMDFESDLGGLMGSPLAKDGLITVVPPQGPSGSFTFVGGSHLAIPKNASPSKRRHAQELFLFMLRADNIDYYSRHSGFIPSDRSLVRIWMQDPRYSVLIDGLETRGRSNQNIPEWSEIEMMVNTMVNSIGANILEDGADVEEVTSRLVFETHEKMNRVLGYTDTTDRDVLRERIHLSLTQPVEIVRYEKEIGSLKKSEFSLRVIVVILLGFIGCILLLVAIFHYRKH